MKSRDRQNLQTGLTLDSPLSSLLRNLYIHSLDHCAPLVRGEAAIVTKDQLISILERGHGEKKVRDIPRLLSSSASLREMVQKNLLKDRTPVLTVDEEGFEILPAANLSLSTWPSREELPFWWNAPLPFVAVALGKIILNEKAQSLLGNMPLEKLLGNPPEDKEFVLEPSSGTFLFREVAPSIYLVEDVSSDVSSAREISWWAAVGKAFVEKLHTEDKTTERSDVFSALGPGTAEECLPCLWEGKILGYLLVRHEQN